MQGTKRRDWVRGGAGKLSEGDEAQGLGVGIEHGPLGHGILDAGRRKPRRSVSSEVRGAPRGRVFKFGIAEGGGRQPQIMRPTRVPAQATR